MIHRFGTVSIFLLIVSALLLLGGCTRTPTTLHIYVTYDDADVSSPPASSVLYLRLMLEDGTVIWSNEAGPEIVSGLTDGDTFFFALTPGDGILTDPSDLYMLDAYFYTAAAGPPIDPTGAGDVERFTREVVESGGMPFYIPASHIKTGIEIHSGDLKNLYLTAFHDFP